MGMNGMLKDRAQAAVRSGGGDLQEHEAWQLGSCVRTLLGPNGMNKMVINHLEKLFITSDSTIVKELEVQQPCPRAHLRASSGR